MQEMILKEDVPVSPIMKDIYRRLRTNIEFTGIENKVICITSCVPDDGKSSISYNLARVFAEDEKKVLLIDADMRNSVLYKRIGFERDSKGLSHYLSGKESLTDVMYSTRHKNFFLLPTGRFPKNPTELLSKSRFETLVSTAKKAFDYIIIDTPPLGLVIDAAVVARECDGSVLVVSADNISRKVAKTVKDQLVQANENLLGVVLNKVDVRDRMYGKKYGYGYGYGYGSYGAEQKKK